MNSYRHLCTFALFKCQPLFLPDLDRHVSQLFLVRAIEKKCIWFPWMLPICRVWWDQQNHIIESVLLCVSDKKQQQIFSITFNLNCVCRWFVLWLLQMLRLRQMPSLTLMHMPTLCARFLKDYHSTMPILLATLMGSDS